MPASNLAKVFGPTVIGYSVPDPEPLQMINETKYQAMVMFIDKSFETLLSKTVSLRSDLVFHRIFSQHLFFLTKLSRKKV